MNIFEILDEIERAYPEDIFPEVTIAEQRRVVLDYPGIMDRVSASMGRHLAFMIRQKLSEQEALYSVLQERQRQDKKAIRNIVWKMSN